MQFTLDGRLLVKQLSGDDQASLQEYGPGYCERVTASQGDSLLARLFFHFKRVKDGKFYVVMSSIFPAGMSPDTVWDLKGCADDKLVREHGKSVAQVHKRWFMLHWFVSECTGSWMLPPERKKYKEGKTRARTEKFTLEHKDLSALMDAVRHDVNWLRNCELMDYSLMLGVLHRECNPDGTLPAFPLGGAGMASQPLVFVQGMRATAYYVGIIDFLQGWTGSKQCAHFVKLLFAPKPISTVEPGAYADQFLRANHDRFRAPAPTARTARNHSGPAPSTLGGDRAHHNGAAGTPWGAPILTYPHPDIDTPWGAPILTYPHPPRASGWDVPMTAPTSRHTYVSKYRTLNHTY